jgi:hypothetical protein
MYEEIEVMDEYYPVEQKNVDTFSLSNSDSESLDDVAKKRRKMLEDLKKMDSGYHKLYRFIDVEYEDKHGKSYVTKERKPIEIYSSSIFPRSKIRGAIGGAYYPSFKVGSSDENLFFKIAMATGECKDNNIFFFDTPEQYEKHMNTTLEQPIKEKWYEKFNAERISRQAEK